MGTNWSVSVPGVSNSELSTNTENPTHISDERPKHDLHIDEYTTVGQVEQQVEQVEQQVEQVEQQVGREEKARKIDMYRATLDMYLLPDLSKMILEYSRIKPIVVRHVDDCVVLNYRTTDYKMSDEFTMANYTDSDIYNYIARNLGSAYAGLLMHSEEPITQEISVHIDKLDEMFSKIERIGVYAIYIDIFINDGYTDIYSTKKHCITAIYLDGPVNPVEWDSNVAGVLSSTVDAHYDLTNYVDLREYIEYYVS